MTHQEDSTTIAQAATGTGEQPGRFTRTVAHSRSDEIFRGAPVDFGGERVIYRRYRGREYALYARGHIYFAALGTADPGPVKIGWSTNPGARTYELQFGIGARPKIVQLVDIPRGSPLWGTSYDSLEQELHRGLERHRIDLCTFQPSARGEWYLLSGEHVSRIADWARDRVSGEGVLG